MREIDNPRLAAALRQIPGIEKRTIVKGSIVRQEKTLFEIQARTREGLLRMRAMALSYPLSSEEHIVFSAKTVAEFPCVGEIRVSQELGKGSDGFDRALEVLGE